VSDYFVCLLPVNSAPVQSSLACDTYSELAWSCECFNCMLLRSYCLTKVLKGVIRC